MKRKKIKMQNYKHGLTKGILCMYISIILSRHKQCTIRYIIRRILFIDFAKLYATCCTAKGHMKRLDLLIGAIIDSLTGKALIKSPYYYGLASYSVYAFFTQKAVKICNGM